MQCEDSLSFLTANEDYLRFRWLIKPKKQTENINFEFAETVTVFGLFTGDNTVMNRPAACVCSPLRTEGICAVSCVCGDGTAVVATVISMDPSGGESTSPYM